MTPRNHGSIPRRTVAALLILLAATLAMPLLWQHFSKRGTPPVSTPQEAPQRIIALSPSIVEIVYLLCLDDRLVGVSRYSRFPPEAAEKPVVGGYLDLDFEHVIRLRPDCVLLLKEQDQLAERLHKLGIRTIAADHTSTTGIIDSIRAIGTAFQRGKEAESIITTIRGKTAALTRKPPAGEKPRVLVCIDRDTSAPRPERIIAAGNAGVHQEYISMAGGRNVYRGKIAYPVISREKLIQLNPDIIIELIPGKTWRRTGREKLLAQWSAFPELRAVRTGKIHFLHEDQHMIPGPRFPGTLRIFTEAIQAP